MNQSVFISGIGYIGAELTKYLSEQGFIVYTNDLCELPESVKPYSSGHLVGPAQDLDIRQIPSVDFIINLAGGTRVQEGVNYSSSLTTTLNLRKKGAKLILASTVGVYNHAGKLQPYAHPYSSTKYQAEREADVSLRLATVNGPNFIGNHHLIIDLVIESIIDMGVAYVINEHLMRGLVSLDRVLEEFHRCLVNEYARSRDVVATYASIDEVVRRTARFMSEQGYSSVVKAAPADVLEKGANPMSSRPPASMDEADRIHALDDVIKASWERWQTHILASVPGIQVV